VFDSPVPCLFESALLQRRVERVLAGSGLEIWVPGHIDDLGQFPEEIGVVVLEGRLLSQGAHRKALVRLKKPLSHLRAIVLLQNREAVPHPPSFPPSEVCAIPWELQSLRRRIEWARLDAWKFRVNHKIRHLSHLPTSLQEALVAALNQRVPLGIGDREMLRTEEAIARKIKVSRERLSRAAGVKGISLPSFLGACNALNALAELKIERRSLNEVAIRMGYSGQSGLTELLKRTIAVAPKDARSRPLVEWVRWWERHVLKPLPTRRDDGHRE